MTLIEEFRACTTFGEIATLIVQNFLFDAAEFEMPVRGDFTYCANLRTHWSGSAPPVGTAGWRAKLHLSGGDDIWTGLTALANAGVMDLSFAEAIDFAPGSLVKRRMTMTAWLSADMYSAMWLDQKLRQPAVDA